MNDIIDINLHNLQKTRENFPLITQGEALALVNSSSQRDLLQLTLSENDQPLLPLFQFDLKTRKPFPLIHRLSRILDGLSGFGVYIWFTSYSEDLECCPAEALASTEKQSDLLYLAGLFASESRVSDLTY